MVTVPNMIDVEGHFRRARVRRVSRARLHHLILSPTSCLPACRARLAPLKVSDNASQPHGKWSLDVDEDGPEIHHVGYTSASIRKMRSTPRYMNIPTAGDVHSMSHNSCRLSRSSGRMIRSTSSPLIRQVS